ncbi:MAG: hypothetical protein K1X89_12305 [Myxococcaceae bacterium]|nr:hypothetical protein [Myxococcaceae bacterium]
MRRAALLTLLLSAACPVAPCFQGAACDDTHLCPDGFTCVSARCQPNPGTIEADRCLQGGSGGGGAGGGSAGGGSAGGGSAGGGSAGGGSAGGGSAGGGSAGGGSAGGGSAGGGSVGGGSAGGGSAGGGQPDAGVLPPYVVGSELKHGDGRRLTVSGVNLETLRYVDTCTTTYFADHWANRVALAQRLRGLGINVVRLNVGTAAYQSRSDAIDKLADLIEAFAAQGIYSMPSDHSHSGQALTDLTDTLALMGQIVAKARARGVEAFLVLNPFSEPGTITWSAWQTASQTALTTLRGTHGFSGVVVLDTINYATGYDATTFTAVVNHEKSVNGGKSNVVFAHGWYPNIPLSNAIAAMNHPASPLLVTGVGAINPGTSPYTPTYPADVADWLVDAGIPQGHNGLLPWLWLWCDENSLTDGGSGLTEYGALMNSHYFAKIAPNFAR